MKPRALLLLLLSLTIMLTHPARAADPVAINRHLARGVNLGNWLEAPKEGQWGVHLDEPDFQRIAAAGFDHVRIPVRWSVHMATGAPYAVDAAFFDRVQWAVDEALKNNLAVVLNNHHDDAFDQDPANQLDRVVALWAQIAERFRAYPDELVFELYNEPHAKLDAPAWNAACPMLLAAVRRTNPTRVVVVGPAMWNNPDALASLVLPDDAHLILTFHHYAPFHFTHQGASWVGEQSQNWLGTTWTGSPEEVAAIDKTFDRVADFAAQHRVPVYLGEFGAYEKADMPSRARWTRCVRAAAEQRGFGWAYWEYCSGFGVYDPAAQQWRSSLLDALTGD